MCTDDSLLWDWEKLLSNFAPNLVHLYSPKRRVWIDIERKMTERYRAFMSAVHEGSSWTTATTIFDLAMIANDETHLDNQISKSFLKFIDNLAIDLSKVALGDLHNKAKNQLKDLFINFDITHSKYLEKVGELAFTLYAIHSTKWTLIDIEPKLPNNKKIDLVLKPPGKKSEFYIDIFNIHIDDKKLHSEDDIEAFLNKRIADKISSKQIPLNECYQEMLILPVLWCQFETLVKFRNYLINRCKRKLKSQELPCCALLQLSDNKGNYDFNYGSVSSLLETSDKYETIR